MKVPVEISYRHVSKSDSIESLIYQRCEKLETICDYISSCRISVEQTQTHQRRGQPFRVRIDMTVPPSHELSVSREPSHGEMHTSLATEIRNAFNAAERQIMTLKQKQRMHVKRHPEQDFLAVVEEISPQMGYGYLRTLDGRRIYFHEHSVLNGNFERMTIGTGVSFVEQMGEEGPQASSIHIVDKPAAL